MLQFGAALLDHAIEANDGVTGTVSEFLFDDRTWKVRRLVLETGSWLADRSILLHPSVVGRADCVRRALPAAPTRHQTENSPNVWRHREVSRQMGFDLCDHYGFDRAWDSGLCDTDATGADIPRSRYVNEPDPGRLETWVPHLRGLSGIAGCGVLGSDGPIGHVEHSVLEDDVWNIRSLIVGTGDAAPGNHALFPPRTLCLIDWLRQMACVDISRDRVDATRPWAPLELVRPGARLGYGSRP